MKIHPVIASSSVLVLTLMSATLANANDAPLKEKAAATSSSSALKVVIDKETGALRAPTSEEAAQMSSSASDTTRQSFVEDKAIQGVAGQMQHHANGVSSMVLDPSKFQSITAKSHDDGRVVIQHGDHEVENHSALEER